MFSTTYPPEAARAIAAELGYVALFALKMVESMAADAAVCRAHGYTTSEDRSQAAAHSWQLAATNAAERAAHFAAMALDALPEAL